MEAGAAGEIGTDGWDGSEDGEGSVPLTEGWSSSPTPDWTPPTIIKGHAGDAVRRSVGRPALRGGWEEEGHLPRALHVPRNTQHELVLLLQPLQFYGYPTNRPILMGGGGEF